MTLTRRWLAVVVPGVVMGVLAANTAWPQVEAKPNENRVPVATGDAAEGVHVAVFWDAKAGAAVKKVGDRKVKSDEELQSLLTSALSDWQKAKKPDVVLSIDAAGEVPWRDLVAVVAMGRKSGWKKVEFVTP